MKVDQMPNSVSTNLLNHSPSLNFLVQNRYYMFAFIMIILFSFYILMCLFKKRDFTSSLPAIGICSFGLCSGLYFTVFSFLILKEGILILSEYAPGELYLFAFMMGIVVFGIQSKKYFDEIRKLFL